jgi:hypothetical protein
MERMHIVKQEGKEFVHQIEHTALTVRAVNRVRSIGKDETQRR